MGGAESTEIFHDMFTACLIYRYHGGGSVRLG